MKISALIRELYVSPEPQSLMKDFFDRCYYTPFTPEPENPLD